MPDLLFSRNQVLLAKTETSRGVDASPAGADDAVLAGVIHPTCDGTPLNRISVRDSISALQTKFSKKKISFSIQVELKGAGTAGNAPEWAPLMLACGAKETITPATSAVYAPENHDSAMKSATIYLYKDGRVWKAVGCMGNVTIAFAAGEYPIATFSMVGRLSDIVDAANPTATLDTTEPVQIQSAGFSFGSWNDAVMRNFSLQSGNTIGDRNDINSSDGYKGPFISAHDPSWNAVIEAVNEATAAMGSATGFFSAYLTSATVAFDITHGTVAGNIIEFAAPKAGFGAPGSSDESTLEMLNLSGQLLESVSEDNWTITVK